MSGLNIDQETHIRDYINILKRRRGTVILFFITTVFVVAVASFVMTPIYRATVTILVDLESPDVLTASGMVSLEPQNYYSYKEYLQSQKEIIVSRSITCKVFDEFNLGETEEYSDLRDQLKVFSRKIKNALGTFNLEQISKYEDFKDLGEKLSQEARKAADKFIADDMQKKIQEKDPIKKFLKTINVEIVRDTRLLKLQVDNKNPVLAAKIANRIAEIYVKRNLYYISRNELMNLLKNEYLKLEKKLSEYNKIYKGKHPKMIRLKKEINELVKKIDDVKKTGFDYDAVMDNFKGENQYALEGLKANNINIEDYAEVPIAPIKPKEMLNILLAAIVGLFGGAGLAFFFEYLDDTIKRIEDLEKVSTWPFLGSIPKIGRGWSVTKFKKHILTHIKPKTPIAETYKTLRTGIFFSSTEEHPVRNMLITSPGPQEGKTTTLCNLGISIAQAHKRVLLVDADMRRPRLHEVFRKKNKKGLSDFLCAKSEFNEAIHKTGIERVSLVTGGTHPPNPSELLSSHKMAEFIEKGKEIFDFILFDTPPVVVVTDAVILSRVVDGIVMVVESGKTRKKVIPRIYKTLETAKARVIGVVLNKISLKGTTDYYYYSRYYGR